MKPGFITMNLSRKDHIFGPLKEGVRGQHFSSDQKVEHAVRNWLKMQPADFYKAGIVSLVH